jgi:hypothetical protein
MQSQALAALHTKSAEPISQLDNPFAQSICLKRRHSIQSLAGSIVSSSFKKGEPVSQLLQPFQSPWKPEYAHPNLRWGYRQYRQ